MASCPICHRSIEVLEQNKGALFNCPNCGAVFFIGWDGQPEISSESAPVPSASSINRAPLSETIIGESPMEFEPMAQAPSDFEPLPPMDPMNPIETLSEVLPETPKDAEGPMFGETEKPYEDFADVAAFGNSNTAKGNLSYNLLISGVELPESVAKLREALTDARFGWNVDELMKSLTMTGEIHLKDINPAKASILVGRIQFLPIEIAWTQEVFDGSV